MKLIQILSIMTFMASLGACEAIEWVPAGGTLQGTWQSELVDENDQLTTLNINRDEVIVTVSSEPRGSLFRGNRRITRRKIQVIGSKIKVLKTNASTSALRGDEGVDEFYEYQLSGDTLTLSYDGVDTVFYRIK